MDQFVVLVVRVLYIVKDFLFKTYSCYEKFDGIFAYHLLR